jgi:hypothetical protein
MVLSDGAAGTACKPRTAAAATVVGCWLVTWRARQTEGVLPVMSLRVWLVHASSALPDAKAACAGMLLAGMHVCCLQTWNRCVGVSAISVPCVAQR